MENELNNSRNRQWMAVYTKPRSEKKIAERLERQGLEVYCPLQITIKQWSDRRKKVSVPVFPSYVFLHVNALETNSVLQDPGVLNFVYWLGKPAAIREEEINNIKSFLTDNQDASFRVIDYQKDETVVINSGPLLGRLGTIDRLTNNKAVLKIESFGMILKVEINPGKISKTGKCNENIEVH